MILNILNVRTRETEYDLEHLKSNVLKWTWKSVTFKYKINDTFLTISLFKVSVRLIFISK